MCIKDWEFDDTAAIKVVWSNMLAIVSKNNIVIIDWDGNIAQTLRGHTSPINSLQFYKSHIISLI